MRNLALILLLYILTGCYTNYPATSFWINNNSDKTVNFSASVTKYSQMGPYKMTLPFTIGPHDSVLFRQTGYRTNANPVYVFDEINFFQYDPKMNNPKDSMNWIKSSLPDGKPKYTFYIYPKE